MNPITPTEKHRALAEKLLRIGGGCDGADDYPGDLARIANILAHSESEAIAQLREAAKQICNRVITERDGLVGDPLEIENARLTFADIENLHKALNASTAGAK